MPDLTLMAKVLADYAKGKDALATVAKRYGTSDDTIRRWALEDAEAYGLYTRARNISAGAFEDEALEIAKRADATSYNADRLRIDTLKWAAAKRYPKEYGDRQVSENTGTVTIKVVRDGGVSATARIGGPEWAQPVAALTDGEYVTPEDAP